jgi:hypothetical protein
MLRFILSLSISFNFIQIQDLRSLCTSDLKLEKRTSWDWNYWTFNNIWLCDIRWQYSFRQIANIPNHFREVTQQIVTRKFIPSISTVIFKWLNLITVYPILQTFKMKSRQTAILDSKIECVNRPLNSTSYNKKKAAQSQQL